MSDLHDIFYFRNFQNNDSISLDKKFYCPNGTLLITGLHEDDNVILYCTCCNYTHVPGDTTRRAVRTALETLENKVD